MEVKLFEVRDAMTCLPVIAINADTRTMNEQEGFLMGRVGFAANTPGQEPLILFGRAMDGNLRYNSHEHGTARTMQIAHDYVAKHWDKLTSGDVVDVQFIEGETSKPKQSERITSPY